MNEFDKIIDEDEKNSRKRGVQFKQISHVYDLVFIGCKTLYTIFFALIILVSVYEIILHGIYDWLYTIISIINSLEWTSISILMLFATLKTVHSIFDTYFNNKNSNELKK